MFAKLLSVHGFRGAPPLHYFRWRGFPLVQTLFTRMLWLADSLLGRPQKVQRLAICGAAGQAAGKVLGAAGGEAVSTAAGIATGVLTQTAVDNLSPAAEIAGAAISDAATAVGGAIYDGVEALTDPASYGVPDIDEEDF